MKGSVLMSNNNKELAKEILENIGGSSNIHNISYCMTRLRFVAKNDSKVNVEQLKKLPGVLQVIKLGDQYQVVLGGIVDEVYREILSMQKESIDGKDEGYSAIAEDSSKKTEEKGTVKKYLDLFLTTLSEIVTPVIPALVASGFIKTFCVLLSVVFKVPTDNSTYQILNIIADTLYDFFPIIIGWSAAKKFQTNIAVSLMILCVLINPKFSNLFATMEQVTFLGIKVTNVYYPCSVIPAILAIYFLSKFEQILKKYLPKASHSIAIPFLSALIIVPLTILFLGPIGVWGGNALSSLFTSLYAFSPILAGALIGGVWQILIIFGMHIVLLSMITVPNIARFGRDTVIMTHAPSLICQIAAGLAVSLKAKNPEIKRNAFALSLTSFFAGSVIEPVMYGVNLKYKKPFLFVCIGGAIGGAITGASHAGTTAPVAFSLYTIPAYLGPGFSGLLTGVLVGALVTFVLTYIFGIDESIE
ncbi:PTS transporter subunit EIIC [Tepidanaerobacter syntrophicus]|uniref:PTS transporter subunit EIIC n=1 Tax=Tepidanaerobacter syntrophicus TaxID=224999 RepID=UPI00249219DF|nr:PTS transporter subunit EIIC [Tepidanaerobacter syntrophicus]